MPTDAPRFLDRRPGRGYTDRLDLAMRAEPEAISAATQQQQTARVHRDERDQLLLAWAQTTARINGALDHFEMHAARDRAHLRSALRSIRRSTESVGRQLRIDA